MHQFECSQCGYDMTGIEHLTNTIERYSDAIDTDVMNKIGLYNAQVNNTIKCPNCGKVGQWLKAY